MEGSESRAADQTRDGSPTCGTRAVRQIGDKGSPLHLGSGHLHPGSELLPHRGSGLLGSSQPPLGGVQPRLGSGQPRLGSVQPCLGDGHHLRGDHGGESAVGITEDEEDPLPLPEERRPLPEAERRPLPEDRRPLPEAERRPLPERPEVREAPVEEPVPNPVPPGPAAPAAEQVCLICHEAMIGRGAVWLPCAHGPFHRQCSGEPPA